MSVIAPSLLAADFLQIGSEARRFAESGAGCLFVRRDGVRVPDGRTALLPGKHRLPDSHVGAGSAFGAFSTVGGTRSARAISTVRVPNSLSSSRFSSI